MRELEKEKWMRRDEMVKRSGAARQWLETGSWRLRPGEKERASEWLIRLPDEGEKMVAGRGEGWPETGRENKEENGKWKMENEKWGCSCQGRGRAAAALTKN